MKSFGTFAPVALVAAVGVASPAQASPQGWQTASDIGVYSLMAASIGVPLVRKDTKGALQAAGSIGAAALVATGLKEAFPKTRPDGSDRKSFPSGHTSNAFAAAASLTERQGLAVGIPAFAVAGFVGLARVEGKKHYWSDVAVGAGIGTVAGFLITHKHPDARQTALYPWGDTKSAGFTYAARF
jgi:membrane-associated phospholipid phosphatase